MSEIKSVEDFYTMLSTIEVPDRAGEIVGDDPEKEGIAELLGFASYAMEALEAESWTTQPQQVFFRRKLGKPLREVALPSYSLLEEDGAVHLFAFHYQTTSSEPQVLEQRLVEREKNKLEGLVELLRGTALDLKVLEGDPALPHLEALRKFLRSERCKVVKYFVVTNQKKNERSRPEKTRDGKVFTEIVDIDRLFRWSRGVASRSEIEVKVSDYLGPDRLIALRAPDTTSDVTTFVTVLPGKFLAELYENFDNRLLELNVRAYLSAKGKVNKGILETVRDPEKRGFFLPYNNGIVLVVEDMHFDETSGGICDIRWIRGIQIVNGGQTTASLFKARRDQRSDDPLPNVYVQAKIVRLNNAHRMDEIVKSISRFANSQNKVEMADLGANEAFHRRVEQLADKEVDPKEGKNWFYERMRNAYATQLMLESSAAARRRWQNQHPKERVLTKTDLSRYLTAWDRQPWVVARGGQKCFDAFAQSYHVKPIRSDKIAELEINQDRYREIIGKVLLYRAVHRIVRADREAFPSNQINVATYTVSYVSRRVSAELDWKAIWRNQGISGEMQVVLKAFARRVAEFIEGHSQGRLASEVCKREGLFEDIWRALAELPLPLDAAGSPLEPIEMKGRLDTGVEPLDADEEQNIAEVMAFPAERFQEVVRAATANKETLSEYHLGVVQNLAELASGGWRERPRPKQAKMFLKAMATLENYGYFDGGTE